MTDQPLVARTHHLDLDIDPMVVAGADGVLFSRNRVGFGGRGVAARISRTEVADALTAVRVETDEVDRSGSGPVAFGALPFLPGAPAELVIPEVLVCRDPDGSRWITTVQQANAEPFDIPALAAELHDASHAKRRFGPGPGAFSVVTSRAPADWTDAVAQATARIRSGGLEKVVLAREVVVTADAPIPVDTVLLRLAQAYPDCYLYLVDGFCGASPELLVGRSGDQVKAQPMAGTAPRRGDPAADAKLAAGLLSSASYRHEHQVTIDEVHDGLLAFSSYVDYEPEPSVVALANVQHLATTVEGRLSHPPASILDLVEALHPTPAVCGRPRNAALQTIADLEGFDRGPYAGAVGWVDADGNGQWAVSIRGASIQGNVARVVAGNGLVADSDPATELIETRAKLQAMLAAIVRP
ncbi:MAG: isochorismate synthase [Aquihabitans sp.]